MPLRLNKNASYRKQIAVGVGSQFFDDKCLLLGDNWQNIKHALL